MQNPANEGLKAAQVRRLGCEYFQVLRFKILQASSGTRVIWFRSRWSRTAWSTQVIDVDPSHFSFWLGYIRTRKVPRVEAGTLRQRLTVESEEVRLKDLADELRMFVDWRREDLQRRLVLRGTVLHVTRWQRQDLSTGLGCVQCYSSVLPQRRLLELLLLIA